MSKEDALERAFVNVMVCRKSRRSRTEATAMSKSPSANKRESNDARERDENSVNDNQFDVIEYGRIERSPTLSDDRHVYSQIYEQPVTYESLRQDHPYSRQLPAMYEEIGTSNV